MMNSLPILHLFLLLLAHQAPRAQGLPLSTRKHYNLIKEIEANLNKPPVPSQAALDSNEQFILRNTDFLKINLDEFLNAAKNLQERGENIRRNLEKFKPVLPTAMATEDPITITKGDWDDFRRKLNECLKALKKWVGL